MNRPLTLLAGTVVAAVAVIGSGVSPYDRITWALAVAPSMVVFPLLWATRTRCPLTPLLYWLIAIHAVVLAVGGAYTYARVPLGFWVADFFGWQRNPYDKLGHFFQGFVPALAAREILLRGAFVRGRRMLVFIVVCIVLAVSAAYELIEWAAALALGQGADEFLGTQGYQWDTQSDMFLALIGAVAALVVLAKSQDRQIAEIDATRRP